MSDDIGDEAKIAEINKPSKRFTEKPKRKVKRRAAAAPKVETPKVTFPGLTETGCATACNANGCVISGKSYCAHPRKGGLHAPDLTDPEALKRLHAAKKQLAIVDANKRYD